MTRTVGSWYDAHARALYLVALAVAADVDVAAEAVVAGMGAAESSAKGSDGSSTREGRRLLARGVFDACAALSATRPSGPTGTDQGSNVVLVAWVASMDRDQREVLALCAYGGHSAGEAAEVLSIPPTEVHRLLLAALRNVALFTSRRPSCRG